MDFREGPGEQIAGDYHPGGCTGIFSTPHTNLNSDNTRNAYTLFQGEGVRSAVGASWAVLKQISRAVIFFVVFAVASPLVLGLIYGVPAGSILSLIASTVIFQAAAPPLGLALGLTPVAILTVMACFAIGMVVAILEVCQSLALSSQRVKDWIEGVRKRMEKYPAIKKYGVITCVAIAWIPGIGLYGTPIIAWILGWRRIPAIIFTALGFVIAAAFVLFFSSMLSIDLILIIVGIAAVAGVTLLVIRKFFDTKRK